jgi:dienelactone hydrolase
VKVGAFPERPVSFSVGTVTLAGILHVPIADGVLRGTAVVLVPGGLLRRVGLHRLYVSAARALARQGAWAFRFDLPGVGESGGQVRRLTPARLASLEASHAEEVGSALDLLERETDCATLALLGHCSGGRSALACAAADSRVGGVVTWATPVGGDRTAAPTGWIEEVLHRLRARATPVLWVYGTRDVAWSAFQKIVATLTTEGTASSSPPWTIHTIASANHDFTSRAWTGEAIDATIEWMTERAVSWNRQKGVRWTSA